MDVVNAALGRIAAQAVTLEVEVEAALAACRAKRRPLAALDDHPHSDNTGPRVHLPGSGYNQYQSRGVGGGPGFTTGGGDEGGG